MTAGVGLFALGAVTDLWDVRFNGFEYPGNKQVVPILGTGTSTQNFVLQQSAPVARQGRLSVVCPDSSQKDTLRGYYESSDEVVFTDLAGVDHTVVVLDLTDELLFGDVWSVEMVLLETAEPAEPS